MINKIWNKFRQKYYSKLFNAKEIYIGKDSTFSTLNNIKVEDNVYIGNRVRVQAWENYNGQSFRPSIIIRKGTLINDDTNISAISTIEIGENVLIGSRVSIIDNNHGYVDFRDLNIPPIKRELVSKGSIIIADNVWIGEGVVILGGVSVGENSIIGANSVVTKSIEKNSVYAGLPAKLIKKL